MVYKQYIPVTALSAEHEKYNVVYRLQLGIKAAKHFTCQVLQPYSTIQTSV